MKSSRKIIERSRRYSVSENYVVRVTLKHYDELDQPLITAAELLDLSPGGAKLSLAAPFQFQDDLIVSLESEELNLHLSLSARICWLRQQGPGNWILGCAFDPQLPDAEIEHLFSYGLLERREAPRQSVRGQATACWENAADETPLGLLDLSSGGFSMLSPAGSEAGRRLRLSLESEEHEPFVAAATMRWQLQVDGGWIIGCEFDNPQAFTAFKQCFGSVPQRSGASQRRRLVSLASIGAGAVLLYWCWQAWGQL
jgi:hypothetical protein